VTVAEQIMRGLPRLKLRAARWPARLSGGQALIHVCLFVLVVVWTMPTAGLFISSLRDKQQLSVSGWWTSLVNSQNSQLARLPTADAQIEDNGAYVIRGSVLSDRPNESIGRYGLTATTAAAAAPGEPLAVPDGGTIVLARDGTYQWSSPSKFTHARGPRIFFVAEIAPRFTLDNYIEVLSSEGVGRAFINTATVTIPATIIPIMIAAFAAYALAWMRFPARRFVGAVVVALLVVPLQMSLIPLLTIYNNTAHAFGAENGKTYLGVWLAHTAFGLPLAIYLLRNYIAGLPKDLFEAARLDGATHFQVFTLIVLPLSVPALASFAIFQFLWVWNDLLVAMVFLGTSEDKVVLTGKLITLLGSRGTNWEILTAGAFVAIAVPLVVFFSLQRYFVRGILAGSVK
jgi:alpha-glucoside transport system permease protein